MLRTKDWDWKQNIPHSWREAGVTVTMRVLSLKGCCWKTPHEDIFPLSDHSSAVQCRCLGKQGPSLTEGRFWLLRWTHQEGTEHVEADEIEDSEAAATGVICFGGVGRLRLWVTLLVWETRQHDFLPGLTGGTPGHGKGQGKTAVTFDVRGSGTLATCSSSR